MLGSSKSKNIFRSKLNVQKLVLKGNNFLKCSKFLKENLTKISEKYEKLFGYISL